MRSKAFEKRYHDLVEHDPIGADPRDFIRNALSYSSSSPASSTAGRAGSASVRDGGVFVRENNDNVKSNSNFRSNWKERKTFSSGNIFDERRESPFKNERGLFDGDWEGWGRRGVDGSSTPVAFADSRSKLRSELMSLRRKERNDGGGEDPFSSYPAPSTVERQRRAQERVTAALRKLKIERKLEKTPEVFGRTRRSFASESEEEEDASARTYRRHRVVRATEKEHFLSTPSPSTSRRRDSLNSTSSASARKITSGKGVSPLGPPRRVPVDKVNNSPNLISFSPPLQETKGSPLNKTPARVSPLGPPRRVLKIDQENEISFSNGNNYSSPAAVSRRMYSTPENRVYPTPETKQTQEKLKKSLLERLSKIANDSPSPSSRKSNNGFTARL
jgi:hypothetical protein